MAEKEAREAEVKELEEGDSIKISCTEDRHLEEVKFKWFINDIEIVGETQNMLEIQQFSKSYDNSKVKCAKRSDGEILRIVLGAWIKDGDDDLRGRFNSLILPRSPGPDLH